MWRDPYWKIEIDSVEGDRRRSPLSMGHVIVPGAIFNGVRLISFVNKSCEFMLIAHVITLPRESIVMKQLSAMQLAWINGIE